jgi:acyl carrier protein
MERAGQSSPGSARSQLAQIKVPGAEEAAMETTWTDLDVDSLDLVEVVRILEDHYGIQIVDEKLEGVASVGDAVTAASSRSRPSRRVCRPDGRSATSSSPARARHLDRRGRGRVLDALLRAQSGIADGSGRCADFDPEVAMTPKEARRSDRFTHLGVAARRQAVARRAPRRRRAERFGVLDGLGRRRARDARARVPQLAREGRSGVSPLFVTMMMPNAAAGTIAMRLGARGPGLLVASACATGAHAIGEAARMVARGEADVVVAGGTEATLNGL